MNAELIPIVVTALSVAGAAGTYAYQKYVDRRTALTEIRRAAYRNYLKAFIAMSDTPERVEEIRRRYFESEFELLIVGSDSVIQRVGELSKYYNETNNDRHNRDGGKVRRLLAEVCKSMRADCFERSNLATDEIQSLVSID